MRGVKKTLEEQIEDVAKKFLEVSENEKIQIVSHFDTDGITSATIVIQILKKLDKKFSIKILKNLDQQSIQALEKNTPILFLDLASGSLEQILNAGLKNIFIIDHHQIPENSEKYLDKVKIINPELHEKGKMSSSCLTYLFCKQISSEIKDLAKLAVLGMIGDRLEREVDRLNNKILEDGEVKRKRGLLIYPATRPINKVLEYSSSLYIPGVTGDAQGVIELLRESGLRPINGKYKSIIDLEEEEIKKVTTSIMLRKPQGKSDQIVGDIFLIKLFNKLEDARELSSMVNACSRLGKSELAIQFLMEIPSAKKNAEAMYIKYRQHIISGLKFVSKVEKIEGRGFVIINARDQIKDTIIGTIASIISSSALYEEGTIVITMALDKEENRIKVSARRVGRVGRSVREVLAEAISHVGGDVGGHEFAAGCLIDPGKEKDFIELLKKNLEIEVVRI